MRINRIIFTLIFSAATLGAATDPALLKGVKVEVTKAAHRDGVLHWTITNNLETAVYVYDFYLWGPAYHIERAGDRVIINTAPVSQEASCPPNRFPPVLLLVVAPHRSIDGDFVDSELRDLDGKQVSIRIAVGSDPYTVVAEAKRFMSSKCAHSPYDAIVRWGTILESNTLQLPAAAAQRR